MEPINSHEGDDEKQVDQLTSTATAAEEEEEEERGGGEIVNQNGLQENGRISVNNSRGSIITASSSSTNTNNNTTPPPPSYMGKHRLNAALTQLNLQIQIIQEELDELETLGQSSLVCRELVTAVESIPDALLPEIRGPPIVGWDRWFQGGSRARKRWI